ncbi:MAG: magnesium/cobalt transporter CorA [archaeon]
MTKAFHKNHSNILGKEPGSIIFVGDKKQGDFKISSIEYSLNNLTKQNFKTTTDFIQHLKENKKQDRNAINWININGLDNISEIEQLGNYFNLSNLILEDVVNTNQRPIIEYNDKSIFIVLKAIEYNKVAKVIETEQISLVILENNLITFCEKETSIFDNLINRLENKKSILRQSASDFLAYSIIDLVIDNYFTVIEEIGDNIEVLQNQTVKNPSAKVIDEIYKTKSELMHLRKSIIPLRDILSNLQREELTLIKKGTHIYLRDLYDHITQIIDSIETYRDIISGLMEVYLSSISNRMNEIMKVLTIFSTIFIPLTFIVGIYGMNFNYMPELQFKYGYFIVLGLMALILIAMIFFFRKKKWI